MTQFNHEFHWLSRKELGGGVTKTSLPVPPRLARAQNRTRAAILAGLGWEDAVKLFARSRKEKAKPSR